MTVHEYRPGSWIAIVGEGAVALLHPDIGAPAARDLWRLTRSGSRLGTWVEHLAGRGIRTLPSFAMVEAHPSGLSVLVRGELVVQVGDEQVSGAGYTTWREAVLPGAAGFTITVAGAAEAAAGAGAGPGARTGTPPDWLPVGGGIVLASALRTLVEQVEAPQDNHAGLQLAQQPDEDEDLELTLMHAPALAAAIGRPALNESGDGGEAGAAAPGPAGPAVPPAPADVDPAEDAEYDHLFWSTGQLAAEDAEPRADADGPDADGRGADQPVTPANGLEATQVPEDEDEPFVPPVTHEVPGGTGNRVPWEPPAPVPGPGLISEVPWARPADDGDHDGHTVLPSQLPSTPRQDAGLVGVGPGDEAAAEEEPALELVLSTGLRVEVTRPVLLGRAPESARFRGSAVPRLVTVANPQRDISGTHVEIRPAGDHVVVTDMNSTNGTVLVLPGQPAFRLHPGTGVPVPPGGVVELGTGVSITVVRAGEEVE
ncbi:FHA domain-containing protein [Georgenia sp. EYE_87]|uniref:FHA domain-containing protein n=1 Tax=Georgenia sp. EYE_87 TaxID=2853448 RepID=UPI002005210D|nr:FHA domain-containing protein [Georgenia sp. EYE_87]MCK6209444.1 FHA domain-containing protein [Georgenia sp. EYE_87]